MRASSLYRTEPLGDPRQPWFVNCVCELGTGLEPLALLEALHEIEAKAGRPRSRPRWQARVLDLDLLLYDQVIREGPRLVLPHPGLARRRFVLEPLVELDSEVRDPRSGSSAVELLTSLDPLDDGLRVEKLSRVRNPEHPQGGSQP